MLYFCSSDNLLSASWLRLFDGFQNVSGKILYFVFRPKTLLFSDVRCFCFSAEITNVARYPAGRSPRCSNPWPGWILGRVRTKRSADFSVVSVLQQFHWRMRRSDVTFDSGETSGESRLRNIRNIQRGVQGPGFLNAERPRTGSGPVPVRCLLLCQCFSGSSRRHSAGFFVWYLSLIDGQTSLKLHTL